MAFTSVARDMSKVERLALASAEAPILRNASAKSLARRVTLYDPETGAVTGYASGRDALKGLAKIHELEHVVEEGVRPKEVVCQNCGKTVKVAPKGGIPTMCTKGCDLRCEGHECTRTVSIAIARRRIRDGGKRMCRKCSAPQRLRAARVAHAARTREQWMATAQKREASISSAQRSERAQKGNPSRSERVRKAHAAKTAEERSAIARKRKAAMTAKQRSEQMRKAWATRRANAAASTGAK